MGGRLKSYKNGRPGESEVMCWVAAPRGWGNGRSCWGRDGSRRKENQCPAGELGGASGPGRQQAWSPEPARAPVLRSGEVGQVPEWDTQPGRSLLLVTTWFSRCAPRVPHTQPWGAARQARSRVWGAGDGEAALLLSLLRLQPRWEL